MFQAEAVAKAEAMKAERDAAHAKAQARIKAQHDAQGPTAIARAYARMEAESIVVPGVELAPTPRDYLAPSRSPSQEASPPPPQQLVIPLESEKPKEPEPKPSGKEESLANTLAAMRNKEHQDAMALLMAGDGVAEAMRCIQEHKATQTLQRFGRYVLRRKRERRQAAIRRLNMKRLQELEVPSPWIPTLEERTMTPWPHRACSLIHR